MAPAAGVRIAVVGDVHNQYSHTLDTAALKALDPDMTVFVGDFANEDVDIVRAVAQCPHRKVVILGNHDAWFSLTPRGRTRLARSFATSAFAQPLSQDRVADMLRVLDDEHIGYATCRADDLATTFVGARPFSRGGTEWDMVADFYRDRYGIHSLEDSASRIAGLLAEVPADHACVVIGHSGPTGLGSQPHSICGADFLAQAGDWGDPDLQWAIQSALKQPRHTGTTQALPATQAHPQQPPSTPAAHAVSDAVSPVLLSKPPMPSARADAIAPVADAAPVAESVAELAAELAAASPVQALPAPKEGPSRPRVPLVLFGHMHEQLCATGSHSARTGLRDMVCADVHTGTLYVNAAVVPRVRPAPTDGATQRHVCVVDMEGGVVSRVQHVWVEVGRSAAPKVVEESVVCKRVAADSAGEVCYSVFHGSRGEWALTSCRVV